MISLILILTGFALWGFAGVFLEKPEQFIWFSIVTTTNFLFQLSGAIILVFSIIKNRRIKQKLKKAEKVSLTILSLEISVFAIIFLGMLYAIITGNYRC